MKPRVFVTGLGVVSPIGTGVESYWKALLEQDTRPAVNPAIRPEYMQRRQTYSVPDRAGSEDRVSLPYQGAACRFAVKAASMALDDAGLVTGAGEQGTVGAALGNAMGDDLHEQARVGGHQPTALDSFSFSVAAAVSSALALDGPSLSVSTACSAGLYSVAIASEMIQAGVADVMLVGGSEAISRVAMGCFNRLAAFDGDVCRPFDSSRGGTVMGEGAAILVLESEAHIARRGRRRRYAEVKGAGWSCDGHHVTIPEPEARQVTLAARRALADAGIEPAQIDCVIAHGTGTQQNDAMESAMIESLFGQRVWVTAIKSKLGHGGGSAGAFQCLTAALALHNGMVPPTAHLERIDPSCRIRLATSGPVVTSVENVLLNSYAFGGNNISLVLGRPADA